MIIKILLTYSIYVVLIHKFTAWIICSDGFVDKDIIFSDNFSWESILFWEWAWKLECSKQFSSKKSLKEDWKFQFETPNKNGKIIET